MSIRTTGTFNTVPELLSRQITASIIRDSLSTGLKLRSHPPEHRNHQNSSPTNERGVLESRDKDGPMSEHGSDRVLRALNIWF